MWNKGKGVPCRESNINKYMEVGERGRFRKPGKAGPVDLREGKLTR